MDEIKAEVEDFLRSAAQPVVFEDGGELFDPASSEWRLAIEFGKLLLEAWQPGRSVVRRIEGVAYRDTGILGLVVRKPGAGANQVLELRASQRMPALHGDARQNFRTELTAYLERQYPDWHFERVSNRSDREHSFSAWYTRGLARRGQAGWAFIGLDDSESLAAADAALAYGLIWFDALRRTSTGLVLSRLKLFLPPSAVVLAAHRAAWLDPKVIHVEIFEWRGTHHEAGEVDIRDFGNVETRLTPHRRAEAWLDRHREFLRAVFGDSLGHLDLVADATGTRLSIRALGLQVARLEGQASPRLTWGLEGESKEFRQEDLEPMREFVRRVIALRSPASPDKTHPVFRLQPERWLEALLVRDIRKVDLELKSEEVYPQVPAFSSGDRGVVDILGVLRNGRVAVIELKLDEDIVLPLQGLDYWLRVKWLNDREQFRSFGYFSETELAKTAPRLYLVSPAFRFHSTNERIIRYLHPSIEIVQVGLNQQWRETVRVLFRRRLHPPAVTNSR